MESSEEDAAKEAQAFRPNRRPLAIALLANFVLASLCFGVPYYRGRLHAQASLRAFASFAGCLLAARPTKSLGLGLPEGDRAAFAAQVLRAPVDWPRRCSSALRKTVPPDEVFLWPSFKHAAGDVHAVARLVERELASLSRSRLAAAGRVPERPLLALSKLRGALSLLAQAADVDESLDRNAVTLPRRSALPDPARLPLMAGANAALQLWIGADGLHALALDGRGFSSLRVHKGKLEHHRMKRSSLVRATLRSADRSFLVWAMPRERCEPDRCTHRATGVAQLPQDASTLPTPTWLAGHPQGRVDRSLRIDGPTAFDLLVQSETPDTLEIRRYPMAENTSAAADPNAEPAPLAATQRFTSKVHGSLEDALMLQGSERAIAYLNSEAEHKTAWLWPYADSGQATRLGSVRGQGGFIAACDGLGGRLFVLGTATEFAITHVAADGRVTERISRAPLMLSSAYESEDPTRDRIKLLCGKDHATLIAVDDDAQLHAWRCDGERCEARLQLANQVASFDAIVTPPTTVIAYTRKRAPEQRVLRLNEQLTPLGPATIAAACWDPISGMCGHPTLATSGTRLLLGARDGSDLLVLESADAGANWKPLSGFAANHATNANSTAPLQQHRLRKGL